MADRVLVVDDEQSLRKVLAATLQREGYEVTVCVDGEEAIAALERDGADVVVTDLVMPRMDGLTLLRKVIARHPDVPVIVVTAHGRIDSAVEAMKAGAFDFLAKPFDHEELKAIIAKAARQSDYNQRNVVPEEPQEGAARRYTEIVGRGKQMQELQQVIAKVPTRRRRCSSRARAGPARSWWRPRSTRPPRAATGRSSRSTARPSRASWWKRSCSDSRRAPSPARCSPSRGGSSWPTAGRSSSTRSARSRWRCR